MLASSGRMLTRLDRMAMHDNRLRYMTQMYTTILRYVRLKGPRETHKGQGSKVESQTKRVLRHGKFFGTTRWRDTRPSLAIGPARTSPAQIIRPHDYVIFGFGNRRRSRLPVLTVRD